MISDFFRIKSQKKYLWCEANDSNFTIQEIQVCDCFIDLTLNIFREIVYVNSVNELRERFDKITLKTEILQQKIYSLFGKISVICCKLALYQDDYLVFISTEDLFAKCDCDISLPDRLVCCSFYLENDLSNFDRLCFNCSVNFLKMVSIRFVKRKATNVYNQPTA